ncbi:MAG TPA: hypothetical protein VMR43_03470 [Variovorax sp.]|nr:hypothetical protein [Variovorax sp.]
MAFGSATFDQTFANPPDVRAEPAWLAISTLNITDSIGQTLRSASILLQPVPPTGPTGTVGNTTPSVLAAVAGALGGVVTVLGGVVSNVLAPLVDPLLNVVVRDLLGLDLAKTEVGGRLGCTDGTELVF